ncbi:MAG: repair protein RecN, partial [Pseudomonadota bacterium]
MLRSLNIRDFVIVDELDLDLDHGFTVLTGETGAGKSILLDALSLVLGERADPSQIREGKSKAEISALFSLDGSLKELISNWLDEQGFNLEDDGATLILKRIIDASGRSRAFINGGIATLNQTKELGNYLVDIHGQHAHQRLLTAAVQRESLDSFGSIDLSALRTARETVTHIEANLAALGGDEKSRAREIDLLQFQCDEIETARLDDPDEDALLSREEDALADVVKHQEALMKATALLSDDGAVLEQLGEALRALSPIGSMPDVLQRLSALLAEAEDVSHVLRSLAEGTEENPERLEEIRLRRQLLRDLMRKYGDSLADVLSFGQEARTRLDELTGYAERVEQLEKQRSKAMADLLAQQTKVGNQRRSVAPKLATEVEKHLRTLALPNATVQISVGDAASDPAGESVVFMLTANPGSAPAPL